MVQTITITFDNGKVSVAGPIDDRLFCYGMLEFAKGIISEHHSKKSDIQPSTGIMLFGSAPEGNMRNT